MQPCTAISPLGFPFSSPSPSSFPSFFLIYEPFHFADKPHWVEEALINLLMDKSISAAKRRVWFVTTASLHAVLGGVSVIFYLMQIQLKYQMQLLQNISVILSLLPLYVLKLTMEEKRKTAKTQLFVECLLGAGTSSLFFHLLLTATPLRGQESLFTNKGYKAQRWEVICPMLHSYLWRGARLKV